MVDQYIFNSQGEWVAFKVGRNIFLADNLDWFGRVEDNNEVYSPTGEYIGIISDDDRILCECPKPVKGLKGISSIPPIPPIPPIPGIRRMYPLVPVSLIDVFSDE